MKKIRCVFLFSLLILFVAGCSKTEMDIDPITTQDELILKKGKKHSVLFKSNFITWSEEQTPSGGEIARVWIYGEGNASHLGNTKLFIDESIFFGEPNWLATAKVLFTAANGDELRVDFTGEMTPIPDVFPDVYIWGSGVVTGGTGRFENASGEMDLEATFNLLLNEGESFFIGEIMY